MLRSIDAVYFFGRFNFPHRGYLYVIRETIQQIAPSLGITIVFSETQTTWNKQALPMSERQTLFSLALQSIDPQIARQVHFSSIESEVKNKLGSAYGGYTLDTLRALLEKDRPTAPAIVMGADAALGIPGHHEGITAWKDWKKILDLVTLIIVPRGRYATSEEVLTHLPAELLPYVHQRQPHEVLILSTTPTELELHASSSAIQSGETEYLTDQVLEYAQRHSLLTALT